MRIDAGKAGINLAWPTSVATETADSSVDQRFPRERRLRKRLEFQRVYNEGRKTPSRYFLLFAAPRNVAGPSRAGLTVSRKIGKAVERNRAKRLLREAIRKSWADFPPGVDAVFHARREIREATAEAVEAAVRRALRQTARRLN